MIVRTYKIFSLLAGLLLLTVVSEARPYKNSPIQTIIVPYQRSVASGHPYQYPKAVGGESRNVLVPIEVDMEPRFNLDKTAMTIDGHTGMTVNFVDGAYPVYYMPGNANGRFNGKISLLELQELKS